MRNQKTVQAELERKQARLEIYYEREKLMLSPDGVKSYGMGTRNASRYDTALADIQKAIKTLESDISELESLLDGGSRRKAVSVIPRDW